MPSEQYLSDFDERSIYGNKLTLKYTDNDTVYLADKSGNQHAYIDLISAYGACNFGHCNEKISPFKSYSSDIVAGFYPPEAEIFLEWITRKLSLTEFKGLFQVGGSLAVSTALSLAQKVRSGKILFVKNSFHGLGADALAITSVHKQFAIQNTELNASLDQHCIEIDASKEISEYSFNWDEISCFIFEPIQGANGYIPLPKAWVKNIIAEAKKHGVIVIADEIQCGYYRHGHLSVSVQSGYDPDILLFSKSLTNGLFPFSLILYRNEFKKAIKGNFYLAHTFQTSALGCYAALSVARFIDETPIQEMCDVINQYLEVLATQLSDYKCIKNIFVTGPSISFEVVGFPGKELVNQCLEKRILLFTGGPTGERIRIAPPLTIKKENLQNSISVLLKIIDSRSNQSM